MVKLDRPLCPLDPRHVADPGDNSGGRVQLQIGKAGGIGAQRLIAANDDRHALLAIGDDADMDAFDLRAQRILYLVDRHAEARSEEHTSELQSLMRISYAVFCLKKTTNN